MSQPHYIPYDGSHDGGSDTICWFVYDTVIDGFASNRQFGSPKPTSKAECELKCQMLNELEKQGKVTHAVK